MTRPRMPRWALAGLSPMQRTLRWLEEHGWTCEVVEKWVPGANIRRDLWSCDVLACHPDNGIALIQVGTGDDFAKHIRKVSDDEGAATFVAAGGAVLVFGWSTLNRHGWTPRIWSLEGDRELSLEETLEAVPWQPTLMAC